MPEELAFPARQGTAKGGRPKAVCWCLCTAAEAARGRSGSGVSPEPSQGVHSPSSKPGPLRCWCAEGKLLVSLSMRCDVSTYSYAPAGNILQTPQTGFPPASFPMCAAGFTSKLRVCMHRKAAGLHKQQQQKPQ